MYEINVRRSFSSDDPINNRCSLNNAHLGLLTLHKMLKSLKNPMTFCACCCLAFQIGLPQLLHYWWSTKFSTLIRANECEKNTHSHFECRLFPFMAFKALSADHLCGRYARFIRVFNFKRHLFRYQLVGTFSWLFCSFSNYLFKWNSLIRPPVPIIKSREHQ